MSRMVFNDLLIEKDGIIKGPFGGDIKKSLFVAKSESTYKVYEQGVVLNKALNYGDYYISEEHFKKSLSRFAVKSGDILMTGAGTLGEIFEVPEIYPKGVINQALLRIRLNESIIQKQYFKYFFRFFVKSVISNINGDSVIPNLPPLTIIKAVPVDIPNKTTQQKIASVLSALDDKIELNNKINAELEQMAKTIYDYWFVQFDFPDANGKPYKSSGGKMVWNEELRREVPEGWEVKELRNYISSNRGVSYSGKDIIGGGVPMVNLNSFNVNGTFKIEGTKLYCGEYNQSKVLRPYDLVMCNTQQTALDPQKDIIGKSFLIPDIFNTDIVSSHHVTTINLQNDNLKFYFNSLFNTGHFHRYISGYATGTNILGLNFEGVLSYKTEIPHDNLLSRYKGLLLNIEKQKSGIIKQNQQLSQLRDWLLPMLMNGQVTVGQAYEQVEEVLGMAAEGEVGYERGRK
ncbi:MAG: restriction endonuclease subunit S [Ferruginibacter sp.]